MRINENDDYGDNLDNGKKEGSEEFNNVFAAWKKRDYGGSSSLLGSSISTGLGSSIRSIKNAGTKPINQGAKKLTSTSKNFASAVDISTKRVVSVVDDGAKKVASSTKKVASGTLTGTKKLTRESAKMVTKSSKKLTSAVSGRSSQKNNIQEDDSSVGITNKNKITSKVIDDDDYHHEEEHGNERNKDGSNGTKSPMLQSNIYGSNNNSNTDASPASTLGGIRNQPQSEVQSKIAARYQSTNLQSEPPPPPPLPADSDKNVEGANQSPRPTPILSYNGGVSRNKTIVLSPASSRHGNNKGRTVLSPVRTTRHFKANTSPSLQAVTKRTGSLQDRIKLFSQSNASVPSWAMNIKSAKNITDIAQQQPPLTEERILKSKEKSKWRHEMRKQQHRQEGKSAVPTRLQNVAAAPIQLNNFAPPTFPKSLLDVETIADSIRTNFMFEELSKADLNTLIEAFEKVRVHAGEEIIKQGETGDFFYIIGKGQVSFLVDGKVVGSAGAGKSFGELALLYTSPRAATVIADSDPTHLYRVDQKSFRYIMQTKAQETEGEKMKLLQSITFLKDFAKPDLERLCNCMVLRKFRGDEYIVTKGEEGNAFYILKEGSVKITEIEAGGKRFDDVTLLRPGGYFGERALITSEPRAANVIGQSAKGSCFVIDRDTFERVLGKFSKVILKSQDKVLLEGISIIREAKLEAKVLDQLSYAIANRHFASGQTIMEEDVDTVAALYLVREGSVSIIRNGGNTGNNDRVVEKTIKAGGYFADEHLLGDALHLADTTFGKLPSQLTVVCDEKCVCGLLTLKQCRLFMNTVTSFSISAAGAAARIKKRNKAKSNNNNKINKGKGQQQQGGGNNENENSDVSGQYDLRSSAIMQRRSTIKETFNNNDKMNMEELERDHLLGEGQFGQVWLVKVDVWGTGDEDHLEEFALKIQKWDCGDCSREYAASIKREKEVILSLEHPFIVDLVASYEDEHESLMLMTIVEGGELWNVIHRETENGEWISGIDENHARFYSLLVADALSYMHHRSIIFRDLKPENVLIDRDGYPNIIDFGFAKVVPEGKTFTFCGTPQYVAPEIILSKGHSFGVDHFALGILVYEMISGENPFYYDGLPTSELYEIISKEEPYPLSAAENNDAVDAANGVSQEVRDFVSSLLVKDPNGRLGNLSGRELDILNHPWYANDNDLDLKLLKEKKIPAPFLPDL